MSHHKMVMSDVHYRYPDGTAGLCGVSLCITHGESVALVGANGAGKSTLLLHLNGCLSPSRGEVRIGEVLLTAHNVRRVRRSVGMVFENPDDQLFMPTVFDDVVFGPLHLGMDSADARAAVDRALAIVGAQDLKSRPPYKLSQGEKRAVAIAAVLAMSPDILVMDEPSAGLDPYARRRLIALLKTFQHTKLIATHDLDLALELCERTIVLHQGRVAADGPSLDLFQDEALLQRCRLEKPPRLQQCPGCAGG